MLFSVFALAVDRFVTIGHRTAQFGLLMRCLLLGSPPSPPGLLTRQLCGSGCVLGRPQLVGLVLAACPTAKNGVAVTCDYQASASWTIS